MTKTFYIVTVKTYKNGNVGKIMMSTRSSLPENLNSRTGFKSQVFENYEEAKQHIKKLETDKSDSKTSTSKIPELSSKVKEIVKTIFEESRQKLKEHLDSVYGAKVEQLKLINGVVFNKIETKKNSHTRYNTKHNNHLFYRLKDNLMTPENFHVESKRAGYWESVYDFKSDYKEILEKMILEDLKQIMACFLAKMESKFSGIFKNKEIKSFSSRGLQQGMTEVVFTDGSGFLMSNSIEIVYNSLGTIFNRFPTRFHLVKMSDGTTMKNPSESKMKKDF